MNYSRLEVFVCFFGVCLLCVHVALSIRTVSRADVYLLRATIERPIKALMNFRLGLRVKRQRDAFEERVAQVLEERQEERVRKMFPTIGTALCIILALFLYLILHKWPRWLNSLQDIIFIGIMALFLSPKAFPPLQRGIGLRIAVTCLMVLLTLWVVAAESSRQSVFLSTMSSRIVFLATMTAYSDNHLATVSLVVSIIANSWKYANAVTDDCFSLSLRHFVTFDISSAVTFLLVLWAHQGTTQAEARQHVQMKASKISHSAVMMLLDMICDVVLPLDSELSIVADVPRFAAMTLCSTRSIQGKSILEFLATTEDKDFFARQLASSDPDLEFRSRAFNVDMREHSGNAFRVEALVVPFESLDSSRHYIVGIREIGDTQPVPLASPTITSKVLQQRDVVSGLAKEAQHLGTPAFALSGSLRDVEPVSLGRVEGGDDDNTSSSDASSVASRGMELVIPEFVQTCEGAEEITIRAALSQWNINVPRKRCCSFHATQMEARKMLRKMGSRPCDRAFPLDGYTVDQAHQCGRCGLVFFDADDLDDAGFCIICAVLVRCTQRL